MNFNKYESEVQQFIDNSYDGLKNKKFNSTLKNLDEILETEYADINNALRSMMKKINSETRRELAGKFEDAKAYELGKEFEKMMEVPQLEKIDRQVIFNYEEAEQLLKKVGAEKTTQLLKENSPHYKDDKIYQNMVVGGVSIASLLSAIGVLGLTPLNNYLIGIISVLTAAAAGYATHTYMKNKNMKKSNSVEQNNKIVEVKKTPAVEFNKEALFKIIELRKIEVKKVVHTAVKEAEENFNKFAEQQV